MAKPCSFSDNRKKQEEKMEKLNLLDERLEELFSDELRLIRKFYFKNIGCEENAEKRTRN